MKKTSLFLIAVMLFLSVIPIGSSGTGVKELFGEKYRLTYESNKTGGSVHIPYRTNGEVKPWQSGTGTKKILVIMMEFPDEIHRVKRELFEDIWLSDKRASITKYYNTVSNNRLNIELGSKGVGDWMMASKTFERYILENNFDGDKIIDELITEGNKMLLKQNVDLSEYDSDNNGEPDTTVFFFPGNSPAVGGYMLGDFTFSTDTRTVVMVAEDYRAGEYNSQTLIHELAHAMIPIWDLYDYSYSSDPVPGWDIMGSGSWEGHCGMSSFTRWKAGWIDVKMIDKPGEYSLDDLNGDGPNKAYGIPMPGSDHEWLLLENRQRIGVDNYFNGIPTSGIVIYHVDDKRPYDGRFNTLTMKNRTHGFMFLRVLAPNSNILPDSSPNTLPYSFIEKTLFNIGIRCSTSAGAVMKFTLSYEKPRFPLVSVNQTVYVGKIVRDQSKSIDIAFSNIGIGTLNVSLMPQDEWVTLDRYNFIGNSENIAATINTTGLKLEKQSSKIIFTNASSETSGVIELQFEVTPIIGDLDRNNVVDKKDLVIFKKIYGLKAGSPGFNPEADFNSDAVIDFTDLMMLAKNYKAN